MAVNFLYLKFFFKLKEFPFNYNFQEERKNILLINTLGTI